MPRKTQQTKSFTHKTKTQTAKKPCQELLRQLKKEYEQKLAQAKEGQLKAMADYDNLIKRQAQMQERLNQQAALDLVQKLLSPLHHLSVAVEHLKDPGIKMVKDEFWQVLNAAGLEEINPEGAEFDEQLMEAVDRSGPGSTVTKVMQRGYKFNGQVIKPAKVVVG